ncbi:MAG TPA: protease pro-enzyme activation domain-containing protein [Verrucomicrobiae bacterium]|nr:protease pro-enzyme activation domain-containing protein [Verrucomicrobiae bacterium]
MPRQFLRGQVPAAVTRMTPLGRLPATNQLDLSIGLPLRNAAALDELLGQLYDPASTNFHKFLTPQEFAARFGPSDQDYQAVMQFAESNGLRIALRHPNRVVLDVEGDVSNIEQAFHTTLRTYRDPKRPRIFFAPDTAPSVPDGLSVVTIEGLDDYQPPKPLSHKVDPLKVRPLGGSGPGGYYAGNDFRRAYVPGTTLTGAGQSVGLLEFSSYYQSDITRYESIIGMTSYVPLKNVVVGRRAPGTANNDEVALDIEVAIAMAPGLSQVIVYETSSSASSILSRMANDNLARQLSSSWTWGGGPSTTIDNILKQMAAQGQSFFQASGDNDAYTGSQTLDDPSQITTPVDSTNLTCVGGTTLTMSGAGASWVSESVWNWNYSGQPNVGSGGGISTYYTIPGWQKNVSMAANSGSTVWRNIPDVALTADNVFVCSGNGSSGGFGGTSCAAPLWAGFCALVNEQSMSVSGSAVGFLNPALYTIANSASYASCFHDVVIGNNIGSGTPGLFSAVSGYDLCTGLGTPNGTNLINALAPLPAPVSPVLTLASSRNPSGFKDGLKFTASITPAGATGSIQFLTNGTAFDTEPLLAGAATSANLSSLPRGTNVVMAVYSGDANNLSATNTLAQIVTNHPPTAADVYYDRLAGYPLTISLAELATNWSDADGDTLSLAGIGSSTNGVAITNHSGTLSYFDTNDVDDLFVCTISDGFGGTNFETIYVDIVMTNTVPTIVGVGSGSNGSVTLSLAGAPNHTYFLEATTNLLSSANWLPLETNVLGTNGVWQFTDAEATNFLQRFYRLKLSQ